jgi:hypothetical protein
MSEIVRIKYLNQERQIMEEVCYLIEDNEELFPKLPMEDKLHCKACEIKPPDCILLEDFLGLWILQKEDLISMIPATKYELEDYLNRN